MSANTYWKHSRVSHCPHPSCSRHGSTCSKPAVTSYEPLKACPRRSGSSSRRRTAGRSRKSSITSSPNRSLYWHQYTCLTMALCAMLVLGVTGCLLRVRHGLLRVLGRLSPFCYSVKLNSRGHRLPANSRTRCLSCYFWAVLIVAYVWAYRPNQLFDFPMRVQGVPSVIEAKVCSVPFVKNIPIVDRTEYEQVQLSCLNIYKGWFLNLKPYLTTPLRSKEHFRWVSLRSSPIKIEAYQPISSAEIRSNLSLSRWGFSRVYDIHSQVSRMPNWGKGLAARSSQNRIFGIDKGALRNPQGIQCNSVGLQLR